jgi:hypothetical protein
MDFIHQFVDVMPIENQAAQLKFAPDAFAAYLRGLNEQAADALAVIMLSLFG